MVPWVLIISRNFVKSRQMCTLFSVNNVKMTYFIRQYNYMCGITHKKPRSTKSFLRQYNYLCRSALAKPKLTLNNLNVLHLQTFKLETKISQTLKTKLNITSDQSNTVETITEIRNLLKCSFQEAEVISKQFHDFLISNKEKLQDRILYLEKNKMTLNTLKDNFWVLLCNKDDLKSRVELLKRWKFTNINNGIVILKLPYKTLLRYTMLTEKELEFTNGANRITYFASFVECEEKTACDTFMKYSFMMRINFTTMKKILDIVKSQDILTEDLLSDMWLFRYSTQFISNRVKYLEKIEAKEKCKVIKPWMLRCTDTTLNRFFELKEENLAALGSCQDLKGLLMQELELSPTEVDIMFLKHPALANTSYSKAKEMINFLKTEGFSNKMISRVPRVLCHKQETLVNRMTELRKYIPHEINLQVICRNKKDFLAIMKKMSSSS